MGFLHHGYAYNLWIFAWNVGNHWMKNVSVITSNSKYRFSDLHCGRHYTCFLSPLTNCSVANNESLITRTGRDELVTNFDAVLVYYGDVSSRLVMSMSQLCRPNGKYDLANGRCLCDSNSMPSRNSSYFGCQPYHSYRFEENSWKLRRKETWEDTNSKVFGICGL